jgi:hypothetical protein
VNAFSRWGPHPWREEKPWLTRLRAGLMVSGLIIWGYGAHVDVEWLRLTGIAVFVVTFLIGAWSARKSRRHYPDSEDNDATG